MRRTPGASSPTSRSPTACAIRCFRHRGKPTASRSLRRSRSDGKSLNLSQWFNLRADKAAAGESSVNDPLISYNLAGPANGKTGYYGWDYHDFGPRVSFAYSPRASGGFLGSLFGNGDKTVIRGGFGIVYDRIGAGLLSTFDQNGAFGLSTSIPAPIPCVGPSASDPCTGTPVAPRLTSLTTIPQTDANGNPFFPATPTGGFPFTYPPAGTALAIQWGLDSGIKTPYEYTIDFSVGRQLPGNMSLEVSYVGRLSHRLLGQEDLAMPLNIKDPKSGVDYFTAMRALAKLGLRRYSNLRSHFRIGGCHFGLLEEHRQAVGDW